MTNPKSDLSAAWLILIVPLAILVLLFWIGFWLDLTHHQNWPFPVTVTMCVGIPLGIVAYWLARCD